MSKIIIDRKALFALASETRIEILKKLDKRRMTLTELSESLNMSKTTVKEHLDKLVEAGIIRKVDEGRKWIYYELTEKGRKILHPDNLTKIILLLSSAIASALVGSFEVYRFLTIKPTKPTSIPVPTRIPVPAPIPPPTPAPTFPEIHLLSGLTLMLISIVLILYFIRKIKL